MPPVLGMHTALTLHPGVISSAAPFLAIKQHGTKNTYLSEKAEKYKIRDGGQISDIEY